MAVYFTSSVPHGNTEEVSTERIAQYQTRIAVGSETETMDQLEHVVYVPNIGEFTSLNIEELHTLFRQISGTIGMEIWQQNRKPPTILDAGNSGTH